MKSTRLAIAITREIEREHTTLTALSDRTGRSQSAMSQLIGRGLRASPETMSAISRHWTLPGAGARIMIAHLQDELARADWPVHDYKIEHRSTDGTATKTSLDADLADLRAAAEYVPALACLIADVLAVARAELPEGVFSRPDNTKKLIAADPPATYDSGRSKKKGHL